LKIIYVLTLFLFLLVIIEIRTDLYHEKVRLDLRIDRLEKLMFIDPNINEDILDIIP